MAPNSDLSDRTIYHSQMENIFKDLFWYPEPEKEKK